jgi:hypothetical protein
MHAHGKGDDDASSDVLIVLYLFPFFLFCRNGGVNRSWGEMRVLVLINADGSLPVSPCLRSGRGVARVACIIKASLIPSPSLKTAENIERGTDNSFPSPLHFMLFL